jgi:hypothetical protein
MYLLFAGICVLAGTMFVAGIIGVDLNPIVGVVLVPILARAVYMIVFLICGMH